MISTAVGLGDVNAKLVFYIRNCPPLTSYQNLTSVKPLIPGEISHIGLATGNHWRKIFNVYAKLLFELTPQNFSSWQDLRDSSLLQAQSDHCLLFSPPNLPTTIFAESQPNKKLHVILGKGYGEQLGLCSDCTWLSHDFAINPTLGVIICPYFDYRQLSNKKIAQLTGLIQQLLTCAEQFKLN
tara:strand:- start:81 stop:629 length:549 start_codon:yes stop_codon:yes gene_type:complete